LEAETLHFNETFAERQLSSPALEFLLLATKQARQLHSKAFYELTKQVFYLASVMQRCCSAGYWILQSASAAAAQFSSFFCQNLQIQNLQVPVVQVLSAQRRGSLCSDLFCV